MFFWIWTNFGVWLVSGMYPHSLTGLVTCYFLALPFLKNSIIAAIVWGSAFVALGKYSYLPYRQLYSAQL